MEFVSGKGIVVVNGSVPECGASVDFGSGLNTPVRDKISTVSKPIMIKSAIKKNVMIGVDIDVDIPVVL